jgi:hypothetical protein
VTPGRRPPRQASLWTFAASASRAADEGSYKALVGCARRFQVSCAKAGVDVGLKIVAARVGHAVERVFARRGKEPTPRDRDPRGASETDAIGQVIGEPARGAHTKRWQRPLTRETDHESTRRQLARCRNPTNSPGVPPHGGQPTLTCDWRRRCQTSSVVRAALCGRPAAGDWSRRGTRLCWWQERCDHRVGDERAVALQWPAAGEDKQLVELW